MNPSAARHETSDLSPVPSSGEDAPTTTNALSVTNAAEEMTQGTGSKASAAQPQEGDAEVVKTTWLDSLATKAGDFEHVEPTKDDNAAGRTAQTLSDSSAYVTHHSITITKETESIKQRDAPEGSRSSICRQGEYALTVTIPATQPSACCIRLVVALLSAGVALGLIIIIVVGHSNDNICDRNAIFSIVTVCILELCLLLWTFISRSCHLQLTILPSQFHLCRRSHRFQETADSGSEDKISESTATLFDHLCWKQINGSITDLTRAEIQTTFEFNGETIHTLLLHEGSKQYRLGTDFPLAEIEWLVAEINQVLANIRSMDKYP